MSFGVLYGWKRQNPIPKSDVGQGFIGLLSHNPQVCIANVNIAPPAQHGILLKLDCTVVSITEANELRGGFRI